MMGAVHENDTITSVRAIRKMGMTDAWCEVADVVLSASVAFLSRAVLHDDGRLMSNTPKSDRAKTVSNRNSATLNTALVESALSASEPKSSVTAKPRETYITMMLAP